MSVYTNTLQTVYIYNNTGLTITYLTKQRRLDASASVASYQYAGWVTAGEGSYTKYHSDL